MCAPPPLNLAIVAFPHPLSDVNSSLPAIIRSHKGLVTLEVVTRLPYDAVAAILKLPNIEVVRSDISFPLATAGERFRIFQLMSKCKPSVRFLNLRGWPLWYDALVVDQATSAQLARISRRLPCKSLDINCMGLKGTALHLAATEFSFGQRLSQVQELLANGADSTIPMLPDLLSMCGVPALIRTGQIRPLQTLLFVKTRFVSEDLAMWNLLPDDQKREISVWDAEIFDRPWLLKEVLLAHGVSAFSSRCPRTGRSLLEASREWEGPEFPMTKGKPADELLAFFATCSDTDLVACDQFIWSEIVQLLCTRRSIWTFHKFPAPVQALLHRCAAHLTSTELCAPLEDGTIPAACLLYLSRTSAEFPLRNKPPSPSLVLESMSRSNDLRPPNSSLAQIFVEEWPGIEGYLAEFGRYLKLLTDAEASEAFVTVERHTLPAYLMIIVTLGSVEKDSDDYASLAANSAFPAHVFEKALDRVAKWQDGFVPVRFVLFCAFLGVRQTKDPEFMDQVDRWHDGLLKRLHDQLLPSGCALPSAQE